MIIPPGQEPPIWGTDEPTLPPLIHAVPSPKSNASERFATVNHFVDKEMAQLSPCAIAVWFVLWRDTRPPDGIACVSQDSIARRAGKSPRAVRTALKQLQGRGLLTVVRKGNQQIGPAQYRVHRPNEHASPLVEPHFEVVSMGIGGS